MSADKRRICPLCGYAIDALDAMPASNLLKLEELVYVCFTCYCQLCTTGLSAEYTIVQNLIFMPYLDKV